jgi:hypothetical protein
MHAQAIILVTLLLLACALNRPTRIEPAWSRCLQGWQKVFGLAAVIMTLLIVLNPEFLALGLLGDTAFFDMLVLALSLQMHMFAARAFRRCVEVLRRSWRWLGIPSLGLRYLLTVSIPAFGRALSKFYQDLHRFFRNYEHTVA